MPRVRDPLAHSVGGLAQLKPETRGRSAELQTGAPRLGQILDPKQCTPSVMRAPYLNRQSARIVWRGKTTLRRDQRSSAATFRPLEFPHVALPSQERRNLVERMFVPRS